MLLDALQKLLNDIFPQIDPGKHGEELIDSIIQRQSIQDECYIKTLRNIYFFNGNYSSEIDVVAITEKGIFVIESKNYGGWIFGDENSQKWMQAFQNGAKHQFYNPVKQNDSHKRKIAEYIKIEPSKVFSYIVFASRSELKKVPADSAQTRIMRCEMLEGIMKNDLHHLPSIFSQKEVDDFYNKLLPLIQVSEEEKQRHIEYVRKFSEGKVCPVCGGTLQLVEYKDGIGKYKCTKCSFERTDNIDVRGIRYGYRQYRYAHRKKSPYEDFLFGDFWKMLDEVRSDMNDIFNFWGDKTSIHSPKKNADPFLEELRSVKDSLFSRTSDFDLWGDNNKKRSSYNSKSSYKRSSGHRNDFWGGGFW